ncbi:MAG: non-heme iron oxygenase ferredoxin subunit [Lautropia sp.]
MTSAQWLRVAAAADVVEDAPLGIVVAGREIALFRVAGEIFATDNRCTHGDALLSEGFQLDDCIECPLHQGQFDIRTGAPLCAPVERPIRTWPAKVEADAVFVDLAGPGSAGT